MFMMSIFASFFVLVELALAIQECMHSFETQKRESIFDFFKQIRRRVRTIVVDTKSVYFNYATEFPAASIFFVEIKKLDFGKIRNVDIFFGDFFTQSQLLITMKFLRPGGYFISFCDIYCISEVRQIKGSDYGPVVFWHAVNDNTFVLIRRNTVLPDEEVPDISKSAKIDYVSFGTLGDHYDKCLASHSVLFNEEISFFSMSPLDFNCSLYRHKDRKEILAARRGGGYWLWKPFVVWNAIFTTRAEFVVYCDACSDLKNVTAVVANMKPQSFISAGITRYTEKDWTKRDLFIFMNADTPNITFSAQFAGTCFVLRSADHRSFLFLREWFRVISVAHMTTDSPSIFPNYDGFREHRHDQSIFSILIKLQKPEFVTEFSFESMVNQHIYG
jgi:hypothetical protein